MKKKRIYDGISVPIKAVDISIMILVSAILIIVVFTALR